MAATRIIRPPAPLRPGAGRKTPAQQQAESNVYRFLNAAQGVSQVSTVLVSRAGGGTTFDPSPLLARIDMLAALAAAQATALGVLQADVLALEAAATWNLLTMNWATRDDPLAWTNGRNLLAVDASAVPDGSFLVVTLPPFVLSRNAAVYIKIVAGNAGAVQVQGMAL